MADDWLDGLTRFRHDGLAHVMVTVLEIKGSAPREAGAKMVISAASQSGSIGGGNLEHEATLTARQMIADRNTAPEQRTYHLGADMIQCCGGGMTLLFEPFLARGFDLALFGAGHVGQALVQVLSGTEARIRWIDSRPELLPDTATAKLTPILTETPNAEIATLRPGSMVLVMTHAHQVDFELIKALLGRDDLSYIGLIGSKTKWARFQNRLRKDGVSDDVLARVTSPIGLAGVPGKAPAEIAIGVAADLLQRHAAAQAPPQAKAQIPTSSPSLPTAEQDGDAA